MKVILDDFGLEWTYSDGETRKADYADLIAAYEAQIEQQNKSVHSNASPNELKNSNEKPDKLKIFFLVGQSGTGKDTVAKKLLEALPNLQRYVCCTTRPKRANETDGVDYFFKSPEEYLLDPNVIENRLYEFVDDSGDIITVVYYTKPLDNPKGTYIATGTIDMCKSYQEYFGPNVVYPIFLEVSDCSRLLRCIERELRNSQNYREVARRFCDEFEEYTNENLDSLENVYVAKNDYLDDCVANILTYIDGVRTV